MHNAADLGGGGGGGGLYFINLRNTHECYMKFNFVRIFFTKCEILLRNM